MKKGQNETNDLRQLRNFMTLSRSVNSPGRSLSLTQFLFTYPITDQGCLTSAIARRSALTAGPSSTSTFGGVNSCTYCIMFSLDIFLLNINL
jgi:hypothetical protein